MVEGSHKKTDRTKLLFSLFYIVCIWKTAPNSIFSCFEYRGQEWLDEVGGFLCIARVAWLAFLARLGGGGVGVRPCCNSVATWSRVCISTSYDRTSFYQLLLCTVSLFTIYSSLTLPCLSYGM